MDALQGQINVLSHKVDQLHGIVEQLSKQIAFLANQQPLPTESKVGEFSALAWQTGGSSGGNGRFQSYMEHKDILVDDSQSATSSFTNGEQSLSAEIQIRRLTAQLTAAYNRIAALEEQLLASRMPLSGFS